jgi:protein-tyrosine phosphatase
VEREILLEGCANFRDVGGYRADGGRVRWRRLFRSDALHELTTADVAKVGELGITTVIDLRSGYERGLDGDGPHPLAGRADLVHAPIITELTGEIMGDRSLSLAQRYARIMEAGGTGVVDAVTAIAQAAGGAVFHCAAGKDRTGMLCAVVLGALGVAAEDIAADYAMTGRNMAGIEARLRRHPAYDRTYAYVPRDAMTADHDTMRELIADLGQRHGDMRGFLSALGLAGGTLEALRTSLVEAVT